VIYKRFSTRENGYGDAWKHFLRAISLDLTYSAQTATLSELGISLADVAAFMQEIEVEQGLPTNGTLKDQRGIERLRSVALRMRDLKAHVSKHFSSFPSESFTANKQPRKTGGPGGDHSEAH
jgi:hypothetical protein